MISKNEFLDLLFDENNLVKFIESTNKRDYEGYLVTFGNNDNVKRRLDYFMPKSKGIY
jgi:hypothetical protein